MDHDLEVRLRSLLDKRDVEEVVLRFARASDRRDARLMTELFHEDGIFDHPQIPGRAVPAGDVGWGENAVDTLNALSKRSVHFLPQTLVELEGDIARAETYGLTCVVKDRGGEEIAVTRAVRLFHKLERRDGRTWKIVYRTVRIENFQFDLPLSPSQAPSNAYGKVGLDDLVYHMKTDLHPAEHSQYEQHSS